MESTPSLQPLAPPLCRLSCRAHSSIFERQTKSYGLLQIGTTPELTNRVSAFNLSSFLSNSPENLTLDSIQKKVLGVF